MDRNLGRTLALVEEMRRRWRPVATMLVVTTIDGETHKVPVPSIRRKYSAIGDTLKALAWYKVEAYSDDLLVGTKRHDPAEVKQLLEGPDADLEHDQGEEFADAPASGVTERESELVRLVLEAQKVAVTHQANHQEVILSSVMKLLDTMTQRVTALENSFAQNLTMAQEAAQMVASTESDEPPPQSTALMQQLLPMLMMQLKAPEPKPNGAGANGTPANGVTKAKKKPPGDDGAN